jgi:hypothetical protein
MSGMRYSFINILDPFKLEFLLSMSYLWSLELTLTLLTYLYALASMRQVV